MSGTIGDYTYSSPSFSAASPARPYTPPDGVSISGPTLAYISGGELSSDGMPPSGRRSRGSGTNSPPASVPYAATVPRSHRFNPLASPATRASVRGAHKRRGSRSNDDSDEDDEEYLATNNSGSADTYVLFIMLALYYLIVHVLGAARPFASSASSQSNGGETSSGTVTHVSKRLSLRQTRSPAKCPCSIEVSSASSIAVQYVAYISIPSHWPPPLP